MKIHVDDILEKSNFYGLTVASHPAFSNIPNPMFIDDETRNMIIKKWESENCVYECVDGVWGYYYDNGEEK